MIVFDIETTGLNHVEDRICEIGAVLLEENQEKFYFESLIRPERDSSPGAQALHRIPTQALEHAPGPEVVLPAFLRFIKGYPLAAYNADFDLAFLNQALSRCGLTSLDHSRVTDILTLARAKLPGLGRYSLGEVARWLAISFPGSRHRALADAQVAGQVWLRLSNHE